MTLPTRIAVGLHSGDSEISDLQRAMQAALDAINNVVWTAPTLLNAWVNFGVGDTPAGYMIDTLGFVHLRGIVKNGTVGLTIFTLPAGFRPVYSFSRFAVVSNNLFGYLSIDNAGNVVLQAGSNVFATLDGIIFDTRT